MHIECRWLEGGGKLEKAMLINLCSNLARIPGIYNIHGTKSSTESLGKPHKLASQMRNTGFKVPLETSKLKFSLKLRDSTDFQKL